FDLELSFGAECRIGQADRQPQERVLAALHPRTRAAGRTALTEERVHDVVETESLRESAAAEPAAGGIAAAVIYGTFLWIRKNLVRLGGFLEFFGRIGAVVDVRMKPAGLFPVRLLDVFGGGVPVNPEQVVIVLSHASSQLWPSVALWFLALTEGTAYITGNSSHRGHCSRIVHAHRSHRA